MLKLRVLTALILIPIVIAAIFYMPPLTFLLATLLAILAAGWEWAKLAGLNSVLGKSLYLITLAATLVLAIFMPVNIVIVVGITWWAIAAVLLAIYPRGAQVWGHNIFLRCLMGILVLMPCFIGLIILQGFSPAVLLFCLMLIWGADIAAYFIGRKWGKHKLAPTISPGKSYEGLLAGVVISAIFAAVGAWYLDIAPSQQVLFWIVCVVGGGLVSVFGDLFESMIKRQANIKDSGSLLPGHGGIMDRIDSMTTAIPFFACLLPFILNN